MIVPNDILSYTEQLAPLKNKQRPLCIFEELGESGRKIHIIFHEFTSDGKDNCLNKV